MAPQYLLDITQPYFLTEHAYNVRSNGNKCLLYNCLPLCRQLDSYPTVLFRLQLNCGILLSSCRNSKLIHQLKLKFKKQNIHNTSLQTLWFWQ